MPIWANPEMLSFFNFFLQEYQSEKSPIFDSQGSTKKTRKLLKISHLLAYKVDRMFCNTRYI